MKKSLFIFLTCFAGVVSNGQRVQQLFDASWKFVKADITGGEATSLNDAAWRTVDLPHDWSIENLPNQSDSVIGPFSIKSVGTTATGYTIGGIGWYRKHFNVGSISNKKIAIYFDGVYMNSDVWVNGHHLGNHPYGYTPFYYDITSYLKPGSDNIIAVRVRNEGRNSRWYSGSGIYRHVWLITTTPVHIKPWGIFITTPVVSSASSQVNIKTTVINESNITGLKLVTAILDAKNKIVARSESPVVAVTGNDQNVVINNPILWSPETPYLYQAVTDVVKNGRVLDHIVTRFGIRSIQFSADKGFLLNGKNIELRGGCVHHDNGALGAAAIDRAEERRVELLKNYGFNAVRTAHNPPSQSFLDACDSLGVIVIDEAFDMWQRQKNPQDYHLYFDSCWQRDLDAMVLRDRNHPSVIFWSVGNEVNERVDSSGLQIAKKLFEQIKKLDNTRPVTNALCSFYDHPNYKWDTTAAAFALQDVGSYNYMMKEYESDHLKYPQRIMMGTESYPKSIFKNWNLVEKHSYVIGDFVWTAMDHLGETGVGFSRIDSSVRRRGGLQPFPWFVSWAGDIDITGGKKPQLYFRDIVWRTQPIHMLVHSPIPSGMVENISDWGWPDEVPYYYFPGSEGKSLKVNVYTRYPLVRLELNGKKIDQKNVSTDNLTASFEINYQPGVLKAIAVNNGIDADSVLLQTPGIATSIRLTPDKRQLKDSRNDLSYVTAEIVDANGRVVPGAPVPLEFFVEGVGEIAATANANPIDMQSFQSSLHRTFRGKCLVIVRPKGGVGQIVLKAKGVGLSDGELRISVK